MATGNTPQVRKVNVAPSRLPWLLVASTTATMKATYSQAMAIKIKATPLVVAE